MKETYHFLTRFFRPAADPAGEREVLLDVDGELRGATLFLPRVAGGTPVDPTAPVPGRSVPGWILLQGVTVPGRHHEGLRRMARALAAAGHAVLAPEVPEWTALRVDPGAGEPAVRACLSRFHAWPGVDSGRLGLMAFSVAGTWGLELAARKSGSGLRTAVSVGAYADFRRTVVAMVTGGHEWNGKQFHHRPDPYGRWIVASDLLPRLDSDDYGTREEREVAGRALHQLAYTAGRNGALAGTAVYDRLIKELRDTLPAGVLPAWDVLAPASERLVPDAPAGRQLAEALAVAGLRAHPELDPSGRLGGLAARGTRVVLIHGRQDTLIPFSETLRLATLLPADTRRMVTITALLGHAKAAEGLLRRGPAVLAHEAYRFAATMRHIITSL